MPIADIWLEQLAPWLTPDLAAWATAVATMFAEVEAYAEDDPELGGVGWAVIWDVDLAPPAALGWLAQTVGERLPVGISDERARELIRTSPNQDRGTPDAIVNAVRAVLTGTQTVEVRERVRRDGTPDVDALAVLTFTDETPDENLVLQQLRKTVPADLMWEYENAAAATWGGVQANMADWAELEATWGPTWGDVKSARPDVTP